MNNDNYLLSKERECKRQGAGEVILFIYACINNEKKIFLKTNLLCVIKRI
jgi:hypothetical protein